MSLRVAEGLRAHVSTRPGPVHWSDVPFCNCVVPRVVLDRVGPPAEDIPWDADDFELFQRASPHVAFRNDPALLVSHDRYPDHIVELLAERARSRVRTGEKLVELWPLYRRVPVLALGTMAGPVAAVVLVLAGRRRRRILVVGGLSYGLLVGGVLVHLRRRGLRGTDLGLAAAVLCGLHALSATATPVGVARAMGRRARRWVQAGASGPS